MQKEYKILNRNALRAFILSALEKEQKRCRERCLFENDVEKFLDEVWRFKKYGIISVTIVAGAVPNSYKYRAYTSFISLVRFQDHWIVSSGRELADHRPNGRHWATKVVCKKSFDKHLERKIGFSFCALYY